MSSIYRKGRDGYYYYQTYVINPDNGKKDKRIFHSLNTKDENEAKEKQIQLDDKYENKNNTESKRFYNWIKKRPPIPIIIIFTILITLYISGFFKPQNKKQIIIDSFSSNYNEKIEKIEEEKIPKMIKQKVLNDTTVNNSKVIPKIQENPKPSTLEIPSYKIERIERLSGSFDQGKLYITLEKKTSSESLKLICEKIMGEYSEFSNIIICLYSSDSSGINLAKGFNAKVNIEDIRDSWLAMYTYNNVEGSYFDDNPSGYLGFNK